MLASLVFSLLSAQTIVPAAAAVTASPTVAVPSPCPSSSPAPIGSRLPIGSPAPHASPAPCGASLATIGHVISIGRNANLVGSALSASTGTISQAQITTRPLLRPGEVLEDIPGLVISQHSGGGKANQYYLRGFQLDHGTNLEAEINGVPINLGTHAHGQGYSDINYLLPELVNYVEFKKGTYFADQGDFAVAGGYSLFYRNTIEPTSTFTIGDFGYDRFFTANSIKVGTGSNLLYGAEIAHDNGSYVRADEYHRFNGLLRYSHTSGPTVLAITGMAYNGAFNSTDQIPQRLVDAGVLSRYGYIDPTDGGNTYRYALSGQLTRTDARGATKVNVYGVNSLLSLSSNFTYSLFDANDYYNVTANPVTCNVAYTTCAPNVATPNQSAAGSPPTVVGGGGSSAGGGLPLGGAASAPRTTKYQSYCPGNNTAPAGAAANSVVPAPFSFSCGDQRQQIDKRVYYGFDLSRSFIGSRVTTTIGAGLRNDNMPVVGLYLANAKQHYPNGTLSNDHATNTSEYAYVESEIHLGSKLRVVPGLRFDRFNYGVSAYDPANSGAANEGVLDPKFVLAYALSPHQEFYADFGESFHSNDARGVIGNVDPQTHAPFDPTGAPVGFNSPLTRASGEELGYRYSSAKLTTTVSAFRLLLANELVFDGDHGTTSVAGPDVRQGFELANFYNPMQGLVFDADLATTTARFLTDPLNQGTGVPESLAAVISAGATVDKPHYAASLRMRYFGPRQLDNAGDAKSPPSMVFSTQLTAKFPHRLFATLDVFNLLNSTAPDVTYFYASWTKHDAANPAYANDPAINPALGGTGINDFHFHPSQARTVRVTLSTGL